MTLGGLDAVNPYVKMHKIASFEAQDHQYLARVAQTEKPIILSTGMCSLDDVLSSVKVIEAGFPPVESPWAILHCTSSYPAPISEANLRAMQALRIRHYIRCGLSDHTPGITCPIAAVALGATVIEKHFTDDCSRVGPDHEVAIEPSQFKQMVTMIREVEQSLGDGVKRLQVSEMEMEQYAVKSDQRYADVSVLGEAPGTRMAPFNP